MLYSCLEPNPPLCTTTLSFIILVQLFQLKNIATAENREACPAARVEVVGVEVETWGVTLSFPLVSAPKLKESVRPVVKVFSTILVFVELLQVSKTFHWRFFVSDGQLLYVVEYFVRHQVFFVGLFIVFRTKFGRWL